MLWQHGCAAVKWWIIVAMSDLVRWLKRRWDYDTDIIDLIDTYKDYERTRNGRNATPQA
jgi:hypothetical protein